MDKKKDYIYLESGCFIPLSGIQECFGKVPESFKKCFVCKEPAVNVVCANLDRDNPRIERMSYGDEKDDAIAHALLIESNTTIVLPTCQEHTHGSTVVN
jgi:hypothetical protein